MSMLIVHYRDPYVPCHFILFSTNTDYPRLFALFPEDIFLTFQ